MERERNCTVVPVCKCTLDKRLKWNSIHAFHAADKARKNFNKLCSIRKILDTHFMHIAEYMIKLKANKTSWHFRVSKNMQQRLCVLAATAATETAECKEMQDAVRRNATEESIIPKRATRLWWMRQNIFVGIGYYLQSFSRYSHMRLNKRKAKSKWRCT